MVKAILMFVLVWLFVAGCYLSWQQLTNKEKYSTIKILGKSLLFAFVAFAVITTIVVLF